MVNAWMKTYEWILAGIATKNWLQIHLHKTYDLRSKIHEKKTSTDRKTGKDRDRMSQMLFA